MNITSVVFTGGEPTLHPDFARILEVSEANGLKSSFVTNGWHFEKIWPTVLAFRDSLSHIGFSLDGVTAEHTTRGVGLAHSSGSSELSLVALRPTFPLPLKVGIRRDTIQSLEQFALFSARLGASALNFAHIMPTSNEVAEASALTYSERERADQEIANLSRIFKMKIGIDVGYHKSRCFSALFCPCWK
jgi:MoaA/NifB/PqqE/SkfB family radical SAM enzyme